MNADHVILAVDLDGSLLKTDLLYESFVSLAARNPLRALAAIGRIRRGKAAFKAALAAETQLDASRLPFEAEVLELIRQARQDGRPTTLVSASDQRLVEAVAGHLDCFDEVYGSDGVRNLKGSTKAACLAERFGEGGYDYIGDSRVDLPVWRQARQAITVGASAKLRAEVERVSPQARHLAVPESGWSRWKVYLGSLRPHQWLKNVLVCLPALAAHEGGSEIWLATLTAFIAFSLTAAGVYVLNDLSDLTADRAHPRKRQRPFASGAIPLAHGLVIAPSLILLALVVCLLAAPPLFLIVLAVYLIVTLAYSLVLKRLPILDVCTLAGLYSLRVVAGAAATGLLLSPWMIAFSAFLFLSLAAMKRQTELITGLEAGQDKAIGRAYRVEDLPVITMMALAAGYIAVLVLALYINSPQVQLLYGSPLLLWGACPIVLYWISRLVFLAHRGQMDDDPVLFALRDGVSLLCGTGVLAIAVAASLL